MAERVTRRTFLGTTAGVVGSFSVSRAHTAGMNAVLPNALSLRSKNFAVAIGDSITGHVPFELEPGNPSFIPSPRASWFTYLTWLSQGRVRHRKLANRGIVGQNTGDMLARFEREVVHQKPAFVIIAGGTNDAEMLQGDIETTKSNVLAMRQMAIDAGITPILWTIPPANARPEAHRATVIRYNEWIREYAADQGHAVVDAYAAIIDEETGATREGWTDDGLHPNIAGSVQIAKRAIADGVLELFPDAPPPIDSSEWGPNLIPEGVFRADGDGDGVADGWSQRGPIRGEGSVSPQLQSGDGISGVWQVLATDSGGSTYSYQTKPLASGWAPGDTLAFSGYIETDNCEEGNIAAQAFIQFGGSVTPSFAWSVHQQCVDISRSVFYVETEIPTGTTDVALVIGLETLGDPGSGTIRFADLTLVNLSALE